MSDIQTFKITDPEHIELCKAAKARMDEVADKLQVLEFTYREDKQNLIHDYTRAIRNLYDAIAPTFFSDHKKVWMAGSSSFQLSYVLEYGDAFIQRDLSLEKDKNISAEPVARDPSERLH